jgi:hypothetical protein
MYLTMMMMGEVGGEETENKRKIKLHEIANFNVT